MSYRNANTGTFCLTLLLFDHLIAKKFLIGNICLLNGLMWMKIIQIIYSYAHMLICYGLHIAYQPN